VKNSGVERARERGTEKEAMSETGAVQREGGKEIEKGEGRGWEGKGERVSEGVRESVCV